jgi:nucleotide-binding universal stress UspA family protein
MTNIRTILYPTDFSKFSLAALPYAVDLALRYKAKLHCIHVLDTSSEFLMEGYYAPFELYTIMPIEQLQKTALERLEKFVNENISSGIRDVTKKLLSGKPFVEIIRYAKQENIDLIALGTHGHSAITSMLLGSVAEKVIRKAPCPVLSVRHPEHKFEAP